MRWDLPDGVSAQQVIKEHSRPNLLKSWEFGAPLQVIFHRGLYDYEHGWQENSLSALRRALLTGNLVETDIVFTADGHPLIAHDFNSYRTTWLDERNWDQFMLDEVEHTPLLIRDVVSGKITSSYTVTSDTVVTLETYLRVAFETNPEATVFLDCHDFHAHRIVKWLSQRPHFRDKVVVLFYSFKYRSGEAFARAVDEEGTASNWRSEIALIPVLYPEELAPLARHFGAIDIEPRTLFDAGKNWIDSIMAEEMRTTAISVIMAGVPRHGNSTGRLIDPILQAFAADHAAIALAEYVKAIYPLTKLMSGTRSYAFSSDDGGSERAYSNFNFWTGRVEPWPTDDRKYIRQGYATPGNPIEGVDIMISDRSWDEMSLWQWRKIGVSREVSFDFPQLNTVTRHMF
jgi:hypothetical protein